MGQYFLIVNPAKRQFLDPSSFGMNPKRSGMMQGLPGFAVGLLVSDDLKEGGPTGLLGSWVGDPVIAAGDDLGRPDPAGISTSSELQPDRNLNGLAREEFEDITPQAIAMLAYFGYADELAEFALEHRHPLRYLGPVVFALKCEPLKKALDRLDPDWGKKYKAVCD